MSTTLNSVVDIECSCTLPKLYPSKEGLKHCVPTVESNAIKPTIIPPISRIIETKIAVMVTIVLFRFFPRPILTPSAVLRITSKCPPKTKSSSLIFSGHVCSNEIMCSPSAGFPTVFTLKAPAQAIKRSSSLGNF